jgi:hypothetical protein
MTGEQPRDAVRGGLSVHLEWGNGGVVAAVVEGRRFVPESTLSAYQAVVEAAERAASYLEFVSATLAGKAFSSAPGIARDIRTALAALPEEAGP